MSQPSFAPGSRDALAYLNDLLAKRNVDVGAADAVFGQEGASGGIGDGGHAFGPGQFNDAGGVWTGRYPGLSPEQKNQQAWSPQGLSELAQRVSTVAAGLHGPAAVNSIVSRFERPADIPGEISRALGGLGAPTPGGSSYTPPAMPQQQAPLAAALAPQAPAQPNRAAFAQSLLGSLSPTGQIDTQGLVAAILARRT